MSDSNQITFDDWCGIHGNQKKLADHCGVTAQAINQWRKRVPAERVLQVEAGTGYVVPRHVIRPDLYPKQESAA